MGAKRAFLGAALAGLLTVLCPWQFASAQLEAPSGVTGSGDPSKIPSEDTLETTYGLAMGSGARAGAIGTSALAYNTSNMAAVPTYHVEAFSQIIPGSKSQGGTYWTIGSSVTDSTTAKKIAMGTSFRGVFSGEDRRYSGWDWRSGIGIQAIPQIGIGIGFRWGRLGSEWSDVPCPSEDGNCPVRVGPYFDGITIDASMTVTPIPWLKVSGLGYNLVKTYSSIAPQMAGGSLALTPIDSLTIGGDVLVDFTTFEKNQIIAGGGLSYLAGEMVPLRFGYRRDNGRRLNQITAGAGFNKGKIGAEMALRQDIRGNKETYLLFMFRFVVE